MAEGIEESNTPTTSNVCTDSTVPGRDPNSPCVWEGSGNSRSSIGDLPVTESATLSSFQWHSPVLNNESSTKEKKTKLESEVTNARRLSTESTGSVQSLASDAETVALGALRMPHHCPY